MRGAGGGGGAHPLALLTRVHGGNSRQLVAPVHNS